MSHNTQFQLPPQTSEDVYTLREGVTFRWLHGGQIASITLTSMTREAVEIYFDTVIFLKKAFSAEDTPLLLVDLSKAGTPTPYFNAKLKELEETIHHLEGVQKEAAIVIPPGMVASIFLGTKRLFGKRWTSKAPFEMFQSREQALAWLLGHQDH